VRYWAGLRLESMRRCGVWKVPAERIISFLARMRASFMRMPVAFRLESKMTRSAMVSVRMGKFGRPAAAR
jgi:hypothetical protein